MANFSRTEEQRRRQSTDSEIFREVLDVSKQGELLPTELGGDDQASPGDRRRPRSEREALLEALEVSHVELRRAHAQLAEGQRLSKTGTFTSDLQLDRHHWSDEYYRIFELDPG